MGVLTWDVSCKAQKECIEHLAFILGPHIYKLTTVLAAKITSLPREVGVTIEPASHHAPKVTTMDDDATITDMAEIARWLFLRMRVLLPE